MLRRSVLLVVVLLAVVVVASGCELVVRFDPSRIDAGADAR